MPLNSGGALSWGHCEEEGQRGYRSSLALVRDSRVHLLTGVIFILCRKGTKPQILRKVTKIFAYEADLKMMICQSCC